MSDPEEPGFICVKYISHSRKIEIERIVVAQAEIRSDSEDSIEKSREPK